MTQDELLSGAALLDAPVSTRPIPPQEIIGLDEEMRTFVEEQIAGVNDDEIKLRRLLAGMAEKGLYALEYSGTATPTVRETFHDKEGNCLSFTMLFVAFAREAGLRVDYQMVETPPVFSTESDVIVLANHINTVVRTRYRGDYVVDFNLVEFRGNYVSRKVSDAYALALFYNNVGAQALIQQDYDASFTYLREAVLTYPSISAPWVNLGLLYARHGLYEHARAAYLRGLQVEPQNRSTLSNLATLYSVTGNDTLADSYRKKIVRYRRHNPYYHYAVAQQAYREGRLEDSLDSLRKAIRLKRDEYRFYSLQGQARLDLGQRADARHSFIEARQYAPVDTIKRDYTAQIETLSSR